MENIECPLCGEEHPQGSRFCPTTGQSLENPTRAPSRDSDPQEKSVEIKQIDPEEKPIFLTEMSPVALDLEGWMDDDALRAALEGLVSRNRDGQARQLLDVLTQEPDNATAWIWLAREAQAGVLRLKLQRGWPGPTLTHCLPGKRAQPSTKGEKLSQMEMMSPMRHWRRKKRRQRRIIPALSSPKKR